MVTGSLAREQCVALVLWLALQAPVTGGSSSIRLVNEGSSGPVYQCDTASCAPAQTDNPSRKNLDQMDFYVLPDGCVALASVVLRPEAPGVDVECGSPGALNGYRCESGSCRLLDPGSARIDAVTRPIALPAACGGRIHELILVGAATEAPTAFVECDASSGPVFNP